FAKGSFSFGIVMSARKPLLASLTPRESTFHRQGIARELTDRPLSRQNVARGRMSTFLTRDRRPKSGRWNQREFAGGVGNNEDFEANEGEFAEALRSVVISFTRPRGDVVRFWCGLRRQGSGGLGKDSLRMVGRPGAKGTGLSGCHRLRRRVKGLWQGHSHSAYSAAGKHRQRITPLPSIRRQ